jgi:hypothetical protein
LRATRTRIDSSGGAALPETPQRRRDSGAVSALLERAVRGFTMASVHGACASRVFLGLTRVYAILTLMIELLMQKAARRVFAAPKNGPRLVVCPGHSLSLCGLCLYRVTEFNPPCGLPGLCVPRIS